MKNIHVQYYFRGSEQVKVLRHNSEAEQDIKILLANELWCDPDEIRIHRIWSE